MGVYEKQQVEMMVQEEQVVVVMGQPKLLLMLVQQTQVEVEVVDKLVELEVQV